MLRGFISELMTSDDFRDKAYGELTNQCGHTLIGAIVAGVFCMVFFVVAGEMPHRAIVFAVCFLPYPIVIEWIGQGWRAGDSWFDSAMFGLGILGAVTPFQEITTNGVRHMEPRPDLFLSVCVIWAVLLSARVWKRIAIDAKQRQGDTK